MKKIIGFIMTLVLAMGLLAGCGSSDSSETTARTASEDTQTLEDGTYSAEFVTDSSMFHVNEACEGLGILTVEDGQMTIHVSLVSKNIINLYVGSAEDAEADGAELLEPTTDHITYSDGYEQDVYGFDIPVEAIDTDFGVAIYGSRGEKWYDHVVSVTNVQPLADGDTIPGYAASDTSETETAGGGTVDPDELADGTYNCNVTLNGGSGRASIQSPCNITVSGGSVTATIVWSSENYDYMLVDGVQYLPVTTDGGSAFEIPVAAFDTDLEVVGDTTAMSSPHEIDYTLNFDSSSITAVA